MIQVEASKARFYSTDKIKQRGDELESGARKMYFMSLEQHVEKSEKCSFLV